MAEGVGGLAGWLTRADTKEYGSSIRKPPLSPPGLVFPIVWVILFLLMGIGAARIYRSPDYPARRQSLVLFLVQLGFNFFGVSYSFPFGALGWRLGGCWHCGG